MTLDQVVAVVDELLPKVQWRRYDGDVLALEYARGFSGQVDDWFFAVFDCRDPFDNRGFDGAARNNNAGVVYHMTREQAERAVGLALQQVGGN